MSSQRTAATVSQLQPLAGAKHEDRFSKDDRSRQKCVPPITADAHCDGQTRVLAEQERVLQRLQDAHASPLLTDDGDRSLVGETQQVIR